MGFNPDGGGAISTATDVALSGPQDNQVLTYDSSSNKWANEASSGSAGNESVVYIDSTDPQFGAVADGVTDDTTALEAWYSYAVSRMNAGDTVRMRLGGRHVSSILYFGGTDNMHDIHIVGAPNSALIANPSGPRPGNGIEFFNMQRLTVENLRYEGRTDVIATDPLGEPQTAFDFLDCNDLTVKDLMAIDHTKIVCHFYGCSRVWAERIKGIRSGDIVYFIGSTTTGWAEDITIIDTYAYDMTPGVPTGTVAGTAIKIREGVRNITVRGGYSYRAGTAIAAGGGVENLLVINYTAEQCGRPWNCGSLSEETVPGANNTGFEFVNYYASVRAGVPRSFTARMLESSFAPYTGQGTGVVMRNVHLVGFPQIIWGFDRWIGGSISNIVRSTSDYAIMLDRPGARMTGVHIHDLQGRGIQVSAANARLTGCTLENISDWAVVRPATYQGDFVETGNAFVDNGNDVWLQ